MRVCMCMYACMCVRVRERGERDRVRQRERARARERETDRERERAGNLTPSRTTTNIQSYLLSFLAPPPSPLSLNPLECCRCLHPPRVGKGTCSPGTNLRVVENLLCIKGERTRARGGWGGTRWGRKGGGGGGGGGREGVRGGGREREAR